MPRAGLLAITRSLIAAFRQTTSVPSVLLIVLADDLTGFDLPGLLGDPRADELSVELVEPNLRKLRQETLASVDLVRSPRIRVEVWLAHTKPPVPPAAEGVGGVACLAAIHALDSTPAGDASCGRAGKPAPSRLWAVRAPPEAAPAPSLRRRVRVDAALGAIASLVQDHCSDSEPKGIIAMRMRGLEPPPGCPDTDLNRARLPIPPHPRAELDAKIPHRSCPEALPTA